MITGASAPRKVYTLHYGNDNPPIRDCDIDDYALSLAYRDVYTSTGLLVEAALCYIMEGILKDVNITIEGKPLTVDHDRGIVTGWSSFPNSANYSRRLMMAMVDRYKKALVKDPATGRMIVAETGSKHQSPKLSSDG